MNTGKTNRCTASHSMARFSRLGPAILLSLGSLLGGPASAATVSDSLAALDYVAGFNETNNVEIQPIVVAGSPFLDIRDFAGLSGCIRFPAGSVISIRCSADQLAAFFMDLGNQDDIVIVNEENAVLTGYQLAVNAGLGDDSLTGGNEDDEFLGGSGSDLLDGNGGIDLLYGEAGDDRMLGGNGGDYLNGSSGNDIMYGEAGNDTLDGGSYDDFLDGGSGTDTLIGGSGGDRIHAVDGVRDTIDCGLGRDTVRADFLDAVDSNCENVTRISL